MSRQASRKIFNAVSTFDAWGKETGKGWNQRNEQTEKGDYEMGFACFEFDAQQLVVVRDVGWVDLGVAGNRGERLKLKFVYCANNPIVAES